MDEGLLPSNTMYKSPYLKGHACLIKKLKDSRRRRNQVEGSKDTNKICECRICICVLMIFISKSSIASSNKCHESKTSPLKSFTTTSLT